jgi:two-component system response regulator YesN
MFKVFIADDDPAIVRGLMKVINWEEYGLDISGTAYNGLEALKFIVSSSPDIVITDIKMPYMDGLELISRVKQIAPQTRFIVLSGYDDFIYLKESIKLGIENYILKPVNLEEFAATLANILDKLQNSRLHQTDFDKDMDIIRSNVLYRLVTGSIGEEELNERLMHLNIKLNDGPYTICILRVLAYKTNEIISNDLMVKVRRLCNEIIIKHELGLTFCSPEGNILFLIYSDKKSVDSFSIRKVLKGCLDAVKNSAHLDLFITMGSSENNWRRLNKCYKKAMDLQQYSIILPPNSILNDEIEKSNSKIQIRKIFTFRELNKFIASKDINSLLAYIDGIFNRICNMEGITPSFVQNSAVEILFLITNNVISAEGGSNILDQELHRPVSDIFKLQSLEEIIKFTKDTAQSIILYLIHKQQNFHPVIKRVMDYIRANYSKELSLKCLAYDFNINTNYLGRLFKEELGEYFTDYLNKIRIEKAKELLSKTNKSTREISTIVGYTDPNYFYSLFKKYTGVSPSEFKINAIF